MTSTTRIECIGEVRVSVADTPEAMRHSCAHVMAASIQETWPEAKFGVGPTVENGFYYDVLFPTPIGVEDLAVIERLMRKKKKQQLPFVHSMVPVDDAIKTMEEAGQEFKVELLELLRDKGSTAVVEATGDANVSEGSDDRVTEVSFYQVGDFVDLCRGPHVMRSNGIGHFRLTTVAGAYWRGDEKRPQLQRIYGLCFANADELEAEVARLEEVRLRDHRRLGRELDIFHLSPEVGAGLPLWLPNGTVLRDELEFLAKEYERKAGYQRVSTPHLTNEQLYYQSGHLPYYKDDMYSPITIGETNYYLKPMNCPHHHHIYLSRPRSYRDLPLRLAEYGQVYRYEDSGALSGTIRTRGFNQNDAHIYCRMDQAKVEFMNVMHLHAQYYELLGISDFHMRLSLPDLDKLDKYVNEPEKWRAALDIIQEAMRESGLPFEEAKGDAAFYGPKIDFIIKSAIGTEYAISTNQLDFLATERFGLSYRGEDGKDHPVYVIHRAPLGSHERFIAFLLEHYKGSFPIWLAPVQIVVIPISDKFEDYAQQVGDQLKSADVRNGTLGLRVEVDASSDRMQKKVRNAVVRKAPIILVVGENEEQAGTVSVRTRDGADYAQVDVTDCLGAIREAVEHRDDSTFHSRYATP